MSLVCIQMVERAIKRQHASWCILSSLHAAARIWRSVEAASSQAAREAARADAKARAAKKKDPAQARLLEFERLKVRACLLQPHNQCMQHGSRIRIACASNQMCRHTCNCLCQLQCTAGTLYGMLKPSWLVCCDRCLAICNLTNSQQCFCNKGL